jgi:hypothetical protein
MCYRAVCNVRNTYIAENKVTLGASVKCNYSRISLILMLQKLDQVLYEWFTGMCFYKEKPMNGPMIVEKFL